MAAILEVSGLKKSYKNFELKNVSFSIYEDCITGFIGVNGAGKTTTINALLNLVHEKTKFVCFLLFLSPVIIDIAKRISVPSKLVSLMQSNSGIAAAITCGCGILIWLVSFVISNANQG